MKKGFIEYNGIRYNRVPANIAARYYRMGIPVMLVWNGIPRKIQNDVNPEWWREAVKKAYFRTVTAGVWFYPIHESNIYQENNI